MQFACTSVCLSEAVTGLHVFTRDWNKSWQVLIMFFLRIYSIRPPPGSWLRAHLMELAVVKCSRGFSRWTMKHSFCTWKAINECLYHIKCAREVCSVLSGQQIKEWRVRGVNEILMDHKTVFQWVIAYHSMAVKERHKQKTWPNQTPPLNCEGGSWGIIIASSGGWWWFEGCFSCSGCRIVGYIFSRAFCRLNPNRIPMAGSGQQAVRVYRQIRQPFELNNNKLLNHN